MVTIENGIRKTFGLDIRVMVRSLKPWRSFLTEIHFPVTQSPKTPAFIFFFLADQNASTLKVPYHSPEGELEIPFVTEREVLSVVRLGENFGTLGSMDFIEEHFGKDITTRNWNTVEKILTGK